jgi:hypothetical protein
MCFVLYVGARVAPPIVAASGGMVKGRLHTRALRECDAPVRAHFTLPHVVYVGSDQGCGCGFRHVSFQQGCWPEEEWCDEAKAKATQPNHESLVAFLREHFGGEAFVELYGCWSGDEGRPEIERREVELAKLRSPGFHFHELGSCQVNLGS